MTVLGLNGVLINSYTQGEYLDHPKFDPLLAAIARHGAPLYIHPRVPAPAMVDPAPASALKKIAPMTATPSALPPS